MAADKKMMSFMVCTCEWTVVNWSLNDPPGGVPAKTCLFMTIVSTGSTSRYPPFQQLPAVMHTRR